MPTRGLLGFRSRFMTATGGMGQVHSLFFGYQPLVGTLPGRQFGSLLAWEAGVATPYAMVGAQTRGTFFIEPGTEIYEGMVVGEHIRPEDLAVNLCKSKHLSAVRTKNYADDERMKSIRNLSLDEWIEFIAEDELLEVTPLSLRARKKILDNELRLKSQKAKERMLEMS